MMRMEWLRKGDDTPACWACFLVFDDHVEVLAVVGANEHIDRAMSAEDARTVWRDLIARGWQRVTDDDVARRAMTMRKLREIAYGRHRRR
jgi:hypothetical protein